MPGLTETTTAPVMADETKKQVALIGEDDEFEDFPVDDWAPEDAEGSNRTQRLWDESWDDDDSNDDFSVQLREELKKVDAAPKR